MVTYAETPPKLLKTYVRTSYTLAWSRMLEREVSLLLLRKPSLTDLAHIYPVEHEYKRDQNEPGEHDFSASKTKWSRLRNGKTAIADGEMTARIERRYPHLTGIRKNPIWRILEDPLMSRRNLSRLIKDLEPALGDKLFNPADCHPGFTYKSMFFTDEHFYLVESLEAFTFKLALYRLKKLSIVAEDWPISEKDLVLQLFRICMQQPWRSIADHLLRLFSSFLWANERGKLSDTEAEYHLQKTTTDLLYQQLFRRVEPEHARFLSSYPTMKQYLQSNVSLVQNFWNACFPKFKGSDPIASFSSHTLYWADRASDWWLTQKAAKEKLFNQQSELFSVHYERVMFFGCRKQIW